MTGGRSDSPTYFFGAGAGAGFRARDDDAPDDARVLLVGLELLAILPR
jgi:hypothetical protein